jgi:hypothetical protein
MLPAGDMLGGRRACVNPPAALPPSAGRAAGARGGQGCGPGLGRQPPPRGGGCRLGVLNPLLIARGPCPLRQGRVQTPDVQQRPRPWPSRASAPALHPGPVQPGGPAAPPSAWSADGGRAGLLLGSRRALHRPSFTSLSSTHTLSLHTRHATVQRLPSGQRQAPPDAAHTRRARWPQGRTAGHSPHGGSAAPRLARGRLPSNGSAGLAPAQLRPLARKYSVH